jgi:hypothetical protein
MIGPLLLKHFVCLKYSNKTAAKSVVIRDLYNIFSMIITMGYLK